MKKKFNFRLSLSLVTMIWIACSCDIINNDIVPGKKEPSNLKPILIFESDLGYLNSLMQKVESKQTLNFLVDRKSDWTKTFLYTCQKSNGDWLWIIKAQPFEISTQELYGERRNIYRIWSGTFKIALTKEQFEAVTTKSEVRYTNVISSDFISKSCKDDANVSIGQKVLPLLDFNSNDLYYQ